MRYTVFITYMLKSDNNLSNGYGYNSAIHCNYINKVYLDEILNNEVNIFFNKPEEFKFLTTTGGYGFSAHRICMLVQIVDNNLFTGNETPKPNSKEWRVYDVTNQIIDYIPDSLLTVDDLLSTVFRATLTTYYTQEIYDLSYLNYPNNDTINPLAFGDEYFLFGNVRTNIEAIAHSMDLTIELPMGEFNTSNNLTWDDNLPVYITEVGLYDGDGDLVAIGKLNTPIKKDSTTSRTLVFGVDF